MADSAAASTVATPPKKRSRLKKLILWGCGAIVGLLLLVALLGPTVISSIGRGVIVSSLNERLNGTATLEAFSFSWSGAIRLTNLTIRDTIGETAFSTKKIALDVALWKALTGTYIASLRIEEPLINARRDAAGKLNLDTLMKSPPVSAPAAPGATQPPPPALSPVEGPAPLPRMKVNLALSRGKMTMHDFGTGRTESSDLDFEFTLDTLNDPAKEIDLPALLRGTSGQARLFLPGISMTGLAAKGALNVDVKESHARTDSHFDVNGGTSDFKADVDFRSLPEAASTFQVNLKQVEANAQMSPLLSLIHPIFAVAKGATDGVLSGRIDCDLTLSHNGPLPSEISQGWERVPKKPVQGKGHFQIARLGLQGSPLVSGLLGVLGQDKLDGIELNPIDFTIHDGRLSYDRPMRMKIAGAETQWTGSVGLDQTLDLRWEVPASILTRKFAALKMLGGQKISIPVKGTSSDPKIDVEGAISGLGGGSDAGGGVIDTVKDKVGGLVGGLLGGGAEKEAQALLDRADQLYAEGKKAEAAALYRELHEKHRRSKVYKENKARTNPRESER